MSKLAIINDYWSTQAEAFTEISVDELTSEKNALWKSILKPFVQTDRKLEILDVGCGAGFFEIFLSCLGHHVTAVDFNGKMLAEARKNIEKLGRPELTKLMQMDAQNLAFQDSVFDIVISRNMTWVLENPQRAYGEWLRVLKPHGKLINFDANWFLHLRDDTARRNFEEGQAAVVEHGFELKESDHGGELDNIFRELPLSGCRRPQWDFMTLANMGCEEIAVKFSLPKGLYDEYYEQLYKAIPTFMLCAVKTG